MQEEQTINVTRKPGRPVGTGRFTAAELLERQRASNREWHRKHKETLKKRNKLKQALLKANQNKEPTPIADNSATTEPQSSHMS